MLLEGIYMIYIFKIGVQNDGAITNRVGKQIQDNITTNQCIAKLGPSSLNLTMPTRGRVAFR